MTIYLTIDNNKFGSYLDYPPDVRNYKRLLITNVLMYSFLHAQKRTRPSSARGIGGGPRESPFVELVSLFLVLEDM